MSLHTAKATPWRVAEWAKAKGIKVYFVDNEWTRTPLMTSQLAAFAQEFIESPATRERIATQPPLETGRYVIDAEEF